MFGYDFIIDQDFNCWLIEVNTNPCLEESSQLLKDLLPRMIEDMLKLTVDVLFPKHTKKRKNKKKHMKSTSNIGLKLAEEEKEDEMEEINPANEQEF